MHDNATALLASQIGRVVESEDYDSDKGYVVEVIDAPDALREALPEWREFVASGPSGCSVFNDPDIVDFAVSHDRVLPHVVMIRRAGRVICIAPFGVHSSQFELRFSVFKLTSWSVRLLKMFGDEFVLAADADPEMCVSLVFGALDFSTFDLVYLEALDTRTPLWEYCSSARHKPGGLSFSRPACAREKSFRVELPATFPEYLAMLGSGTRYSRKRSVRILFTDHGATLLKVTSAEQVKSFLDDVDEIYRDSWQSKTYGHWIRNSEDELSRFEEVARRGWLRSYLLVGNGGPMAFLIGFQYRNTYHIPAWAFAQRWASVGPGAVLVYLAIEDLYTSAPPREIDLGYGESAIKRSFCGIPHDVGDYYVTSRVRWRWLVAVQRCLSGVESSLRTLLVRTGLDKGVRRWLKRKS